MSIDSTCSQNSHKNKLQHLDFTKLPKHLQVSLDITVPKGFIVLNPIKNPHAIIVNTEFFKKLAKMIKLAEKNNVILSKKLVQDLLSITKDEADEIYIQFKKIFKSQKGQTFRSVFASGENIIDEEFTYNDFINQLCHYYATYGLGEIDYEAFDVKEKKIQVSSISNISKRKDKQEINKTFKVLDSKNINDFIQDVKTIIKSPIVFGETQIQYIQELERLQLLDVVLEDIQDFKVKENLFQIIDIHGKQFVKDNDILKTSTDILRYCYWASGLDFKILERGQRFKLKTTDKTIVMKSLNKASNFIDAYGEMKTYKSQWLSVSKNLNPGSTKFNKYKKAQDLFNLIRNKEQSKTIKTFNTIKAERINEESYFELVTHLSKRPGELLRSLDFIIRSANKSIIDYLVLTIEDIKLNPKLILQVKKWLEYRTNNALSERTFNIKGKPKSVHNKPLKKLKIKRTNRVIQALQDVLKNHLKGKELF